MPVLTGLRQKIEIKLPVSKGTAWLWEYPLAGEMMGGMNIDPRTGGMANSISPIEVVKSLLADWDFTNDKGEKLPIDTENVKLLPVADFTLIVNHVTKITETMSPDVKKNTQNSSS